MNGDTHNLALEVKLAKYREAAVRADDTINALSKLVETQQAVIALLHDKIGQMDKEMRQLGEAIQ